MLFRIKHIWIEFDCSDISYFLSSITVQVQSSLSAAVEGFLVYQVLERARFVGCFGCWSEFNYAACGFSHLGGYFDADRRRKIWPQPPKSSATPVLGAWTAVRHNHLQSEHNLDFPLMSPAGAAVRSLL